MITHEEARNKVKSNHNKFYTEGEFTKDMLGYITQQEANEEHAKKVEELLGLYREQRKDRKENSMSAVTSFWELGRKIDDLEKELEAKE